MLRRSHARQHEYLRTVVHARAEHNDVGRRSVHHAVALVDDLPAPSVLDSQPMDLSVRGDGEVGARSRGAEVGDARRLALAILHVRGAGQNAHRVRDVAVVAQGQAKAHGAVDDRLNEAFLHGGGVHAPHHVERAVGAVLRAVAEVLVRLDALEDGQAVLVGPAGVASPGPAVQVVLGRVYDGHHVHGRTAAHHASA